VGRLTPWARIDEGSSSASATVARSEEDADAFPLLDDEVPDEKVYGDDDR
jgi:hypothetical protein